MRRSAAAAFTLLVLTMSACAARNQAPQEVSASAGPEVGASAAPEGWRWESYGGIEIAVPGSWGWANGSQRLHAWCTTREDERAQPVVGRPGAVAAIGCPVGDSPNPGTLVRKTGQLVTFDRTTEPPGVRQEGDQTVVLRDGVMITVNAPQELRQRIVDTIRRVDVDSYGCPFEHPIGIHPQQRPPKPVDVASLRDAASVSACKYEVAGGSGSSSPRLVSALRLDGSAAAGAVREIAKAPVGGGPNAPQTCVPEASYGDDAIVLLVRSAADPTEILLRYSGCDHNGFDDGVSVRTLTAAAVAPLVAGPNVVFNFSGPQEKVQILRPS
ncbi:hypothetical protein ABT369_55225 [Dactylosporangium sp. NPDC000244]|uniref:hypothetical protein n=1 Tax=Dactylosporangium sp. NPDC000244 TaxID=3154365 RepID=UPI003318FF43